MPTDDVMDEAAEQQDVLVQISKDYFTWTNEPPWELIRDLLEYRRVFFDVDEQVGYRERESTVKLWRRDIGGRLEVPRGLVPAIAERVVAAGFSVDVKVKQKTRKRLKVNHEAVADVDDYELQEMLKAVQHQPRGQIEAGGIKDKVRRAVAICRMYPKARVLFAVASHEAGRDLRWRLKNELKRSIAFVGRSRPAKIPHYSICTYGRLYHLDPARYDLLLQTDPLRAVGDGGTKSVRNFTSLHGLAYGRAGGRAYSFLPTNMKLSAQERLRLMSTSGPVIHRQSDDRLGVQVVWLPTPSCSAIGDCRGLELKRKAYWHNSRRNDYIAAAARAFAAYDWAKLKKYGVTTAYTPLVCDDERRNPLVAVLVESTEHGIEMQSRLNDWTLLSKSPGATKHSSNDGKAVCQIVTLAAAKEQKIPPEVLINATGGLTKPDVNQFPGIQWSDDPDSLLVDFSDEFDKRTAEQAEQRRRRYSVAGWRDYVAPIF